MSTALVSEDEYLNTVYEPDCEYEDGVLIDRNVGEKDHGRLQVLIGSYFARWEQLWNIEAYIALTHRIRQGKYMVADVCAFSLPSPNEEIPSTPPLIWIEILSPADRPSRVSQKVHQLIEFGVPNIWVIDPKTLEAEIHTPQGSRKIKDGILRVEGTPIEVPLHGLVEPSLG
jgi:Uma2 family endonuclease